MTDSDARVNWAGNHPYTYGRWWEPTTVEELQQVVADSDALRVLGSRHCFNDIGDARDPAGDLVSLRKLPLEVEVDTQAGIARVSATSTYGAVAPHLHAAGRALPNLASLPHITIAGAIATGTHGSGDGNQGLLGPVLTVEYVDADGELARVDRSSGDLGGHLVALGALGVWTHVELAVEPAFEVATTVRLGLPWADVLADLDAVTSAAYSVSLFTDYAGDHVDQAWVKARIDQPAPTLDLGREADDTVHMLAGADVDAVTPQRGGPGPWHERLPHFRMGFTPSRGAEIQSEYLLPRAAAVEAVERLRALAPTLAPVLQVSEIRTVAADDAWLSPVGGVDAVAFHFTWTLDPTGVDAVLADVEAALLPLGARPHWGKVFRADAAALAPAYPRLADFRALRSRLDPHGVFGNDYLRRVLGPAEQSPE